MTNEDLPSNVTAPRPIQKRKRETQASRANKSARASNTPNAYARRTPPREPRPIEDGPDADLDGDRSPPRQLKRPGAGARLAREQRQAAEAARQRREASERQALSERQRSAAELVAEHYNAVPQLGREWRKTDSQIKGLRNLNNWIKSTLIQKFARPDTIPPHGYLVLDMACGKGGDLGKWQKASPPPALYVGCDIADISIDQARGRWAETRFKKMDAEFHVQDTFGRPLMEIPIIRQVGFNPNCGPGNGVIQGGMMTGGFDVVSMMFALHYSFEREDLARGMLKNVAGALKKGGRFIGVMPNSDVISTTVKKLLQAEAPGTTPARKSVTPKAAVADGDKDEGEVDDWDPEKPNADDEDDWDPEKASDPQPAASNGEVTHEVDEDEDWDPEKPSEATPPASNTLQQAQQQPTASPQAEPSPDRAPLEWGNPLYKVLFPRSQPLTNRPLPRDGIFRPPYGWKYFYHLAEAVNAPEYVVPWEGFRALAEEYGLELMYRKGFRDVLGEVMDEGGEGVDRGLVELAERMGVLSRDRSRGVGGLMVSEEELEAAGFYHGFCFYKT